MCYSVNSSPELQCIPVGVDVEVKCSLLEFNILSVEWNQSVALLVNISRECSLYIQLRIKSNAIWPIYSRFKSNE